jgi:hypothetical protein
MRFPVDAAFTPSGLDFFIAAPTNNIRKMPIYGWCMILIMEIN